MPAKNTKSSVPTSNGHIKTVDYDAIVVGAGFGGLRMLHELRKLGLSSKVLEAGTDVGGTWYWNRYPGARTDSEGWVYIMNFSKELKAEWNWSERFPTQPEVLKYLSHVADRFDMRKDIHFNSRVESAVYDEDTNRWTISTQGGESFTCTFFISATGLLSIAQELPFKGVDSFKGESYQTSNWPKKEVDFSGKRVAVIGTGATAVQVIPEIAHSAKQVTVFQRTPNYVIPSRNHPLTDSHRREIKRNYDAIWEQAKRQVFGFPMDPANRTMGDVTPEQYQKVLDAGWEAGGFRFVFETFDDLMVDEESNELAAEFVRDKIKSIVKDERTAELLSPDYPILTKRPPLGHFYYETFNRQNVELVDISQDAIKEITPKGIRTGSAEYEVDMIIFALGFDAVTGALVHIKVQGKDGKTVAEKWSAGPQTYLGICVENFPNMFMISGPQAPFANIPMIIDNTVDWIGQALSYMRKNGYDRIEPEVGATEEWCALIRKFFEATLLVKAGKVNSWFVGANIPGKPQTVLFYHGGAQRYYKYCQEIADTGFKGFILRKNKSTAIGSSSATASRAEGSADYHVLSDISQRIVS